MSNSRIDIIQDENGKYHYDYTLIPKKWKLAIQGNNILYIKTYSKANKDGKNVWYKGLKSGDNVLIIVSTPECCFPIVRSKTLQDFYDKYNILSVTNIDNEKSFVSSELMGFSDNGFIIYYHGYTKSSESVVDVNNGESSISIDKYKICKSEDKTHFIVKYYKGMNIIYLNKSNNIKDIPESILQEILNKEKEDIN